jgi:hypothetical protein
VRNPSERMPVRRVERGKRPGESRECDTAIHHRVFPDVRGVIEADELMPDYLCINSESDCRQSEQDEEVGSPECGNTA